MTKSQLIDRIAKKAPHVPRRQIEVIVNSVFDSMSDALHRGQRIEIRGFGSFAVKVRRARLGRNPKTGQKVEVPDRRSAYFTVGKELRDRLNRSETQPARAPSAPPATGYAGGNEAQAPMAAAPAGDRYTMG